LIPKTIAFRKGLTSDKHLSAGTLLDEAGGVSVNGSVLIGLDGATFINGLTNNVDNSAKGLGTDGDKNWVASVSDGLTTDETFSGVVFDGTHIVSTEMLGDLEDESVRDTLNFKGVKNWGELSLELNVDDGTNNLRNLSVSDLCAERAYMWDQSVGWVTYGMR